MNRIVKTQPIVTPGSLLSALPLSEQQQAVVQHHRQQIEAIVRGEDARLLMVVGPCSIHDPDSALEYARRLKVLHDKFKARLFIVMRVYFEKPRTSIGWRGFINDPNLDGSFDVNAGFKAARKLLLDIIDVGVPIATEFLDAMTPAYIADCVAWAAIGARTVESQLHRELASGLPMAVGFKNNTDGNIQVVLDAMLSARQQHHYLSVNEAGQIAGFETSGNRDTHLILRGGRAQNYMVDTIHDAHEKLKNSGFCDRVMVDCHHANSGKSAKIQADVARYLAEKIAGGERAILGIMMESHLHEGRQNIAPLAALTYGQSITDSCLGFDETAALLQMFFDKFS